VIAVATMKGRWGVLTTRELVEELRAALDVADIEKGRELAEALDLRLAAASKGRRFRKRPPP
jgi:hypothetical protein